MQKAFTLFSLKKRILAIVLVISFIFCSLFVRLFVIQIINGEALQLRATDQWTRDLAIIAPRGKIIDRTGDTLAVSYTTYNVYARAREVKMPSETALVLASCLNLDYSFVYEKITNKKMSESLLKMQVDGEIAEKIYGEKLSGIYLAENSNRYYKYGNLLTQILGFTSVDNVGQTGAEAYFDAYLKGKDGYSFVQSDLQGREIGGSLRYYYPATTGNDITLTIDSKVQIIVEQVLEQIMIEQKAKSVTGIVMDANTSGILALSTKPSFDLNDVPRDDLETLFAQSKVKPVTDIYEPGSTFKILTLSAALEAGVTSLDDHFYCPGYRMVDGIKIKCWRTIGHGSQTLKEAFANSCNCCFMDLALRLGVDRFYEYMQKFGLGQKTGVDIAGEGSGMMMAKKLVKNVDLARMGFGHAIALTPIQLLTAVSSIIDGGTRNSPHILGGITNATGQEIKGEEYKSKNGIVSEKTSTIMNELLRFAENKKGDYTFVEGYNVGGKTGVFLFCCGVKLFYWK